MKFHVQMVDLIERLGHLPIQRIIRGESQPLHPRPKLAEVPQLPSDDGKGSRPAQPISFNTAIDLSIVFKLANPKSTRPMAVFILQMSSYTTPR